MSKRLQNRSMATSSAGIPAIPKVYLAPKGEKTFQFQDQLPPLPQCDLKNTLQRYLESTHPVLTEEEYKHTAEVVKSFEQGVGRELQKKYLERTKGMRNWLEKWWDDKAYMELRMPIVPYINIGGPGPYWVDWLPPKAGTQVERAALILYTCCRHWLALKREQIAVDRGRGKPLCMNQYRRLYNAGRTPGLDKDCMEFEFCTDAEGSCPSHIAIMCKGRLFTFDVLGEDGEILTIPEIERNIQYIRDTCDNEPNIRSLSSLTTTDRTLWAQRYEYLCKLHPDNEQTMALRSSAILQMSLEEADAWNPEEMLQYSLSGDCTNRWADKAVNLFIFKNGTLGSCCDHGPFDGIAYVVATHFSCLMIDDMKAKWQGTQELRDLPLPEEHVLHADEMILKAADEAEKQYQLACSNLDIRQPRLTGLGKTWLRSHGLHPDTVVQLALQFAYYRTYLKPAPTYETATIRSYYHGRTETVRSCTTEALHFSKSMIDINCTEQERYDHFMKAYNKHLKLMKEANDVKGCDRHLLALSIIAEEEGLPLPEIYTDPAWTKSGGGGNYVLSTSFTGFTPVFGGTVAMVENGYGVFYCINPDFIEFVVASFKSCKETDALTFYNTIVKSLFDIRELVDKTHTKPAAKL